MTALPPKKFGPQEFKQTAPIFLTAFSTGELRLGDRRATWEYPNCSVCAKECVFTDGLCMPCWIAYSEPA